MLRQGYEAMLTFLSPAYWWPSSKVCHYCPCWLLEIIGVCNVCVSISTISQRGYVMYVCQFQQFHKGGDAPGEPPWRSLMERNIAFARLLAALLKGVSPVSSSLLDPTIIASTGVRLVSLTFCSRSFSLANTPSQNSSFFESIFRLRWSEGSTFGGGCRGAKSCSKNASNSVMFGDASLSLSECMMSASCVSLTTHRSHTNSVWPSLSRGLSGWASLGDCRVGLAWTFGLYCSFLFLGALKGCMTFLILYPMSYLESRNTTLDKTRITSANKQQHKVRTRRTLHWHALVCPWLSVRCKSCLSSSCLYLAEAILFRSSCSLLSLFFTVSNTQGPEGLFGITNEGAVGKEGRVWKLEGGQVGEKRNGMNIKGGTEIENPLFIRGGRRSNKTLLNCWPPSSQVHLNT